MALSSSIGAYVSPSLSAYAKNIAALADTQRAATTTSTTRNGASSITSLSTVAQLQSQTASLRGSMVGAAQATSYLQVAREGISQIRELAAAAKEIATAGKQGNLTGLQYTEYMLEYSQKMAAMNAVVATTTFDGARILDGSRQGSGATTITIEDESFSLALPNMTESALYRGIRRSPMTPPLRVTGDAPPPIANLSSSFQNYETQLTTIIQRIDVGLAQIDAYQTRLDSVQSSLAANLSGINVSVSRLQAIDSEGFTREQTSIALRQDTAAMLSAQTYTIADNLLQLLQLPTVQTSNKSTDDTTDDTSSSFSFEKSGGQQNSLKSGGTADISA